MTAVSGGRRAKAFEFEASPLKTKRLVESGGAPVDATEAGFPFRTRGRPTLETARGRRSRLLSAGGDAFGVLTKDDTLAKAHSRGTDACDASRSRPGFTFPSGKTAYITPLKSGHLS